jgi:hypothetical protein
VGPIKNILKIDRREETITVTINGKDLRSFPRSRNDYERAKILVKQTKLMEDVV